MEPLISGIQHFFIVMVTTIATAVVLTQPLYKAPTVPTPSPKQEIQAKKEVPSTIPSPTSKDTQSISQTSSAFIATPSSTSVLIDCTGPDGKNLRLTQEACDDFNKAWNNPKSSISISENDTNPTKESIPLILQPQYRCHYNPAFPIGGISIGGGWVCGYNIN